MRFLKQLIAAASAGLIAVPIAAQSQSSSNIRLVVPFEAGGGTDITARVLAQGLSTELGRQVIVINRGGAGTKIGTDVVAKSAPDGQTLLYGSIGLAFQPAIFKEIPYDVKRDLVQITTTGRQPYILAVGPSLPVKSVTELVAAAKQKPGERTFGTAGIGSGPHIASELLWSTLAIKVNHVPYKGSAPALIDLLGGRIDMIFTTSSALVPKIRAGELRALGVSSPKRSAQLPELPTIAEQGFPGYEYFTWTGIFARTGTPEAFQNTFADAMARTLAQPKVKETLERDGLQPFPMSPREAQRYYLSEVERWPPVIRKAGIQPE
jgi:tripartite-type tricarboxylate transporter receptor subunit TctC